MVAHEILKEVHIAPNYDLPPLNQDGTRASGADFQEFLLGVLSLEIVDLLEVILDLVFSSHLD